MFTGLIQGVGRIADRAASSGAGRLTVETEKAFPCLTYGESIAVNGACLTLERHDGRILVFHVMEESFHRTNLGKLPLGAAVNLERAMAAGDRFGGHLVTGHVDAAARVLSRGPAGADTEFVLEMPGEVAPFLVPKGCICVDGISLTVASLKEDRFSVRIIPVTWNETALRFRKTGDFVNLEADLIGKYVCHQLQRMRGSVPESGSVAESSSRPLTMDDLREAGFQ